MQPARMKPGWGGADACLHQRGAAREELGVDERAFIVAVYRSAFGVVQQACLKYAVGQRMPHHAGPVQARTATAGTRQNTAGNISSIQRTAGAVVVAIASAAARRVHARDLGVEVRQRAGVSPTITARHEIFNAIEHWCEIQRL